MNQTNINNIVKAAFEEMLNISMEAHSLFFSGKDISFEVNRGNKIFLGVKSLLTSGSPDDTKLLSAQKVMELARIFKIPANPIDDYEIGAPIIVTPSDFSMFNVRVREAVFFTDGNTSSFTVPNGSSLGEFFEIIYVNVGGHLQDSSRYSISETNSPQDTINFASSVINTAGVGTRIVVRYLARVQANNTGGVGGAGEDILWSDILNKPVQFPPEPHTHVVADISDFPQLSVATHVVYVEKNGVDTNSGLNEELPKLTVGSAITAAVQLISNGANDVEIKIKDAGIYTENISIPSNVKLFGESATVVGGITLLENSSVDIFKHYASANGQNMVNKESPGSSEYTSFIIDTRGLAGNLSGVTAIRNVSSNSILFVDNQKIFVGLNSTGIFDNSAQSGHIHFNSKDIYLTGNNAIGINGNNNSNIIGFVDHILPIGSPTGTVAIRTGNASATIKVSGLEIISETAYNIHAGSDVQLVIPKIVGTRIGTPVFDLSNLGGGLSTLTEGRFLYGGAGDVPEEILPIELAGIIGAERKMNIFYVSDADGDDIDGDGSEYLPFKTINKAIESIGNNESAYIYVITGVYTLDVTDNTNTKHIHIKGISSQFSNQVGITSIDIDTPNYTYKFENIVFDGSVSSFDCAIFEPVGCRIFSNITFGTSTTVFAWSCLIGGNLTSPGLLICASNIQSTLTANTLTLSNCSISGFSNLNPITSGVGVLSINNTPDLAVKGNFATVNINNQSTGTGGTGGIILDTWNFSTTTTQGASAGTFRLNNATPASATKLFIADAAASTVNWVSKLEEIPDGSWIYFQKDEANRFLVKVSGYTAETGYSEFDIDKIIVQGTMSDTDECSVKVDVAGAAAAGMLALPENNLYVGNASNQPEASTPQQVRDTLEVAQVTNNPANNDLAVFQNNGKELQGGLLQYADLWIAPTNLTSATFVNGRTTATGIPGQKSQDADWYYQCIGINEWTRYPIFWDKREIVTFVGVDRTPAQLVSDYPNAIAGMWVIGEDYAYLCVGVNTWRRIAIDNTW